MDEQRSKDTKYNVDILTKHPTSRLIYTKYPKYYQQGRQGGRELGRQGGREVGRQGGREVRIYILLSYIYLTNPDLKGSPFLGYIVLIFGQIAHSDVYSFLRYKVLIYGQISFLGYKLLIQGQISFLGYLVLNPDLIGFDLIQSYLGYPKLEKFKSFSRKLT